MTVYNYALVNVVGYYTTKILPEIKTGEKLTHNSNAKGENL